MLLFFNNTNYVVKRSLQGRNIWKSWNSHINFTINAQIMATTRSKTSSFVCSQILNKTVPCLCSIKCRCDAIGRVCLLGDGKGDISSQECVSVCGLRLIGGLAVRRRVGGNATRFAGPPLVSILTERARRERERELSRTRRAKIGIYQFYSTFSLVFVLFYFFSFAPKMFSALPRSLLLALLCALVAWAADNNGKETSIPPPKLHWEKFGRCKQSAEVIRSYLLGQTSSFVIWWPKIAAW